LPRAHKIKFLRSFFQEKLFFQSFEINQYLSGRTLRDLENEKYIIAPLERLGYAHWYEDPARAERFYFVRWVDETRYSRLSHIHAAPESGAFGRRSSASEIGCAPTRITTMPRIAPVISACVR
jgi:hypothetical protein